MRIWLFLLLLAQPLLAAPVRLGILPQSPDAASAADLLTPSFSKLPDTQILERSELNRLLRERSLAANHSSEALTAASLLGADSLLLIEPVRFGTNKFVILRLVAVKSGAIVSSMQRRWPIEDAEKWAISVTGHFAPLLPKVALPPDRLVKISLLNLRSPSTSANSQLLDRELTTLIRLRLSREPEIILLERQDLGSLAVEKDLAASTERFWNGSHLLDGSINRDGTKPGVVALNLRLTAPGSDPHEIAFEAASTNLSAAADRVATELLKSLKRSSTTQYDSASEARTYLEEAEWSLRWQMYPEAIAAADSAWALGARTPSAAVTRMLAYARAGSDSPHVAIGLSTARGVFALSFQFPDFPPHPQALQNMTDALRVGQEMIRLFPDSTTNKAAYESLCEALARVGVILESYYFGTELREGHEEELAELRKLAREVGTALMDDPKVIPILSTQKNVDRSKPLEGSCEDIFGVMAAYGVYFNETPEQTADLYRQLFSKHNTPRYNFIFSFRGYFRTRPLLGGWKWEDRRRTRLVLEKLAAGNFSAINSGSFFDALYEDLGTEQSSLTPPAFQANPTIQTRRFTNRPSSSPATGANPFADAQERMLEGMPPEMRERIKAQMEIARARRAAAGTNRPPASRQRQLPTDEVAEPPVLSAALLSATDFWKPPTNWIHERWPSPRTISDPKIRDGKVWFRVTYGYQFMDSTVSGARGGFRSTNALVTVDPASLKHQIIVLHRPEFVGDNTSNPNDNGRFEVTSNAFYFVHADTLLRRELDRDQWTQSSLPSVNGDLYRVNDRLFLSGEEGIHEILENGAKTKTLASIRRRPPQTIVDELPTLESPWLAPGPNGSLRAALKNALYNFDGSTWRNELADVTALKNSGDENLFYQKVQSYSVWIKPDAKEPAPLVQSAGIQGARLTLNLAPADLMFTYKGQPALLSSRRIEMVRPADQSGWLFYFFPEAAPLPVEIPVNFMALNTDFPFRDAKTRWVYRIGYNQKIVETETHLLVFPGSMFGNSKIEFLGGFWKIPKTEIDERIRNALAKK